MYSGLISFSEGGIVNKNGVGQNDIPVRPYLKVVRTKGAVTLHFDMEGQESMLIFCKRGKEMDFSFLTETCKSPFTDERPNLTEYSETREYKAVFCADGEPVGEADYLQIKTKGRFRFF
jgi:hypothetical protein